MAKKTQQSAAKVIQKAGKAEARARDAMDAKKARRNGKKALPERKPVTTPIPSVHRITPWIGERVVVEVIGKKTYRGIYQGNVDNTIQIVTTKGNSRAFPTDLIASNKIVVTWPDREAARDLEAKKREVHELAKAALEEEKARQRKRDLKAAKKRAEEPKTPASPAPEEKPAKKAKETKKEFNARIKALKGKKGTSAEQQIFEDWKGGTTLAAIAKTTGLKRSKIRRILTQLAGGKDAFEALREGGAGGTRSPFVSTPSEK